MGSGQDLQCIECGRVARAGGEGWRALISRDPEDDEQPPYVVVYCPDCALREFGALRGRC